MNQSEFYELYNCEENATIFFRDIFKYRVNCCPKCKHNDLKFYLNLKGWRCKKCKKFITIKSISFMRDSNLPLKDWLEIIYLLTEGKKTDSTLNLLRKSRQTRYDTIAFAIKKLRLEMGKINSEIQNHPTTHIHFDNGETQSLIDNPGIPENMNIYIKKLPFKYDDKIRLTLTPKDKDAMHKILEEKLKNQQFKLKKLFENTYTKLPDGLTPNKVNSNTQISKSWEEKIKANFIKEVRGIYHNVSLLYMQGVMDEYCFKYNYRYSLTPKFQVFCYQLLFYEDRIAGNH